VTLGSRAERRLEDAAVWLWPIVRVGCIEPRWKTTSWANWAQKSIWSGYYCGDQTGCQNGMGWKREILWSKENYGEEF
jgi:hypothetical protein